MLKTNNASVRETCAQIVAGRKAEKAKAPTNIERSERAYRAILARYSRDQSVEENIIDILTDIMHLAEDYGEFEEMLETARMHYKAETEDLKPVRHLVNHAERSSK